MWQQIRRVYPDGDIEKIAPFHAPSLDSTFAQNINSDLVTIDQMYRVTKNYFSPERLKSSILKVRPPSKIIGVPSKGLTQ